MNEFIVNPDALARHAALHSRLQKPQVRGLKLLVVAGLLLVAILLAGCEPKRIAVALPIPPERTDCEAAAGKRPTLPPEYVIDWTTVATVGQAKAAHDNFVNVIRGREGIVANYVLTVEGMLAQCSIDAQWVREWQGGERAKPR